jgi:glyoxylase-like metal-dependent hydrolase (beta-lactamase superfamily II)
VADDQFDRSFSPGSSLRDCVAVTDRLKRFRRWLLIGVAVVLVVIVLAAGFLYAFMKYSVLPIVDGERLGNGAVTAIVTGYFGPVAIGAYLVELNDGGLALVDAGGDPTATAIRDVLARTAKDATDVRAIFLTHAHDDHFGGARAFPDAELYLLEPDLQVMQRIAERDSRPLTTVHGVRDGQRVDVSGTTVEAFAVPGHTPGSGAFLVNGVLFFGDSAVAASNGTFQPNTLLGSDPAQTEPSLRALAARLESRRAEILNLAFGHQGALAGLDPLLEWAETAETK